MMQNAISIDLLSTICEIIENDLTPDKDHHYSIFKMQMLDTLEVGKDPNVPVLKSHEEGLAATLALTYALSWLKELKIVRKL